MAICTATPVDAGTDSSADGAAPKPAVGDEVAIQERNGKRLISRVRAIVDDSALRDFFVVEAGQETLVVREDPKSAIDEMPLIQLFSVEFDPDAKRVLFSLNNGRGEAIIGVDLKTKKSKWIASAFGFSHVVIPSGKYRGDLLVYKHLYYPNKPGSYDECWLVDGWTGNKVRDMTDVDPECVDSAPMKRALGY